MSKKKITSGKKKIGVALGTGSARALAHIGVLKALEREGINIDVISGTSFGGLIGGMYASGMKPEEIEDTFLKLTKKKVFSLFRPAPRRSGFIDKKRLEKFVREFVKDIDISELKIPFGAPCLDIMTGETVVIDRGPLVRAIMATLSYPILFTPTEYYGRYLIDGGTIDPLPVDIARGLGAEIVIASFPFPSANERLRRITESMLNNKVDKKICFIHSDNGISNGKNADSGKGLLNGNNKDGVINMAHIFMQLSSILENQILLLQWEKHKPDLLIVPDVNDMKPLEFHRAKDAIPAGEKAVMQALPRIKEIINGQK